MHRVYAQLYIALHNFKKEKKRTWVVIANFSMGMAFLYTLIFLAQAFHYESVRRFPSQGLNLFSIIKKAPAGSVGPGQIRPLMLEEIRTLENKSGYIFKVAPEVRINRTLKFNNHVSSVPVVGVLEDFMQVHGLEIAKGRFISYYDSSQTYCVLGARLYEKLKNIHNTLSVGDRIHVDKQLCEIVGILRPSESEEGETVIDEALFLNFFTLQQFLIHPEITKVTLRTFPHFSATKIKDHLEGILNSLLGDISLFEITNRQVFLQKLLQRLIVFALILGTVGSITIIIGLWNMVQLMGTTVLNRKNIIEIVQILGVHRKKAALQFIMEGIILCLTSGVLGTAVGVGLSYLIADMNGWVFFISGTALLVCLTASALLGVLAAWYPANYVVKSGS